MTSKLVPHGAPTAYFTFGSLTAIGLSHATTTRHCPGIASFSEPISPHAPKTPLPADATSALPGARPDLAPVSSARHVHGAEAGRAPAGGGFVGLVDILTTTERGGPPALFTAECRAVAPLQPPPQSR